VRVVSVDMDLQREPFARPFAFKGSAFHEKWNLVVRLDDEAGTRAFGVGGLAVLWSDAAVFAAHSEAGGNALMMGTLDAALQTALGVDWETPPQLLAAVRPAAEAFARQATGRGEALPSTFVLNALVALDNAAWVLWARRQGIDDFGDWVPDNAAPTLAQRQPRIALTPAVGYNMPDEQVTELLREGAGVLKVKIGHPGDEEAMVAGDIRGLQRLAPLLAGVQTPLTESGQVLLYLDANGRYRSKAALARVLQAAADAGLRERIVVLEEPFAADVEESVGDLGVPVAADESLHDPQDVARRHDAGYEAIAVKPAGKTLSVAFDMLAEATRHGMTAFVADNACVPVLVEWNKNVSARLPAFPGVRGGMMESNGAENYGRWAEMLAEHPRVGAPWLAARAGAWSLDEDYYASAGGVLDDPEPYIGMLRRRAP
jgi:L-alanine-DL-glutamate epimerase-like enolase superfamily enzyme